MASATTARDPGVEMTALGSTVKRQTVLAVAAVLTAALGVTAALDALSAPDRQAAVSAVATGAVAAVHTLSLAPDTEEWH
ncbi:hypothetical protein [Kitasatospora mediocidica]|uniref:hypothetical protein n=1 Tax=Kitasatospora mediocidica TaxID=58352 RepID=UPI0018DDC62C|nr:hypothetical protein [Kitasatospora mediocidica]